MRFFVISFNTIILICSCIISSTVLAGSKLKLEADVLIYSGPSLRFRPLYSGRAGETFSVSKKQVQGVDGAEFYKVLIKKKKSQARVGYIQTDAPVKVEFSEEDEDVDSYKSISLAESAFTIGLQGLKDSTYIWTFGFLKYPTDSIYLKAVVGQLLNLRTSSLMLGGEVGTDQNLYNQFSLYASFSAGVFLLPQDNLIFEGSRNVNYFAQGGTGLRFSADEHAALSIGLFQISLLTPNNSLLSLGAAINLEVGL